MQVQHKLGKSGLQINAGDLKGHAKAFNLEKLIEIACSRKTKLSEWSLKTSILECTAPYMVLNN